MTGPTIIRLIITKPTSTNDLYHRDRSGRVRQSKQYADWKDMAGRQILAQRPKLRCRSLPLAPYAVEMLISVGDRGDIDNRAKALLDLLHQMQITPDDSLLWDFRVSRAGHVPDNSVQVLARSLTEAEVEAARAIAIIAISGYTEAHAGQVSRGMA